MFPLESSTRMSAREVEQRAMHYINKVNLAGFADAPNRMSRSGMFKECGVILLAHSAALVYLCDDHARIDCVDANAARREFERRAAR